MRAVFLDRDGVINELVYHCEPGIIDSPFTVDQLKVMPGVGGAIRRLRDAGYKIALVSNQPGIAKGKFSEQTFQEIRQKLNRELAKDNAYLDQEYYCLHHPEAKVATLKAECECRKPKPGLLLKAAGEMGINLSRSWLVGDGLTDIQAGKSAGCRTILIGKMKCELCQLIDQANARPDAIARDLTEAVNIILSKGA